MKNTFSKLEKVKVQMILNHPFFATVVMSYPIQEVDDPNYTASVNWRGEIRFGTQFLARLTDDEAVFVLAHEAMHAVLRHPARVKGHRPRLANRAQDACINELLIEANMTMPSGEDKGVRYPGAARMTWEAVYAEMLKNPEKGGKGDLGSGDEVGTGTRDVDSSGTDGEEGEDGSGSAADESSADAKAASILAQAAIAGKKAGKMSATLDRMVQDVVHRPVPWYDRVAAFMRGVRKGDDYAWSRPNRRYIGAGVVMPGNAPTPAFDTVAVVVDVSGSITQAMLDHIAKHVSDLLFETVPENIVVLYVDTQIVKTEQFTASDLPLRLTPVGGGGTHMPAAWEEYAKHGFPEPDLMLMFTDGYTKWGSPPGFPLMVVCTTDKVCPHSTTVRVVM